MPYSGDLASGRRTAILATVLVGAVALGATAQEPAPKLLPGGNPCAYPPAARKQEVAGPVRFVARVTPEGVPESVDIQSVPKPDLGFEEAVRDCVSQWRFEPAAPGQTATRLYTGRVRFRVAKDDEMAVRARLEELSAAWNAGNKKALEDLASRGDDFPGWQQPDEGFLRRHI